MRKLAIVVPCHNGSSRLPLLLDSLNRLSRLVNSSDNIFFYFSDNCSTDESLHLASGFSHLFNDILVHDYLLSYDQHLISLANKLNETHIFFLGVNYIIEPYSFLEVWRQLLAEQFPSDICCISTTIETVDRLVGPVTPHEYLTYAGHLLGGISANIYLRQHFLTSDIHAYTLGKQWKYLESGWCQTVTALSIVTKPNSFLNISPICCVHQNPAGLLLSKVWHSPRDKPLYIRLNLYKTAVDWLPSQLVPYVISDGHYQILDISLILYASKVVYPLDLLRFIIYSTSTFHHGYLFSILLSTLIGCLLMPVLSLLRLLRNCAP